MWKKEGYMFTFHADFKEGSQIIITTAMRISYNKIIISEPIQARIVFIEKAVALLDNSKDKKR